MRLLQSPAAFIATIIFPCLPQMVFGDINIPAYDERNFPHFSMGELDEMYPKRNEAIDRMKVAFKDMLKMFRVACVQHLDLANFVIDDAYKRYFQNLDHIAEVARSIYCEAAGIPFADLPSWNSARALLDDGPVNVKYRDWEIVAGVSHKIPVEWRPEIDEHVTATTYQELWAIDGKNKNSALVELYLRAFDFPKLQDIVDHRGLKGLGQKDSGLMVSLGAQLVHEAMHWRYLCVTPEFEEKFEDLVWHEVYYEDDDEEEERNWIDDYTISHPQWHADGPTKPDDGYGPANANHLVVNNLGDSFKNADNHRWYILSRFWSLYYDAGFQTQQDLGWGDNLVPKDTKGAVPFAGEKPARRFASRYAAQGTR